MENRMALLGLDDWATLQRRRKWRWARKVATSDNLEWTRVAIQWEPTLNPRLDARRRSGRPRTRWTDDIHRHLYNTLADPDTTKSWEYAAQNINIWNDLEKTYVTRSFE